MFKYSRGVSFRLYTAIDLPFGLRGRRKKERERGREKKARPFSLPPHPLPLTTPATQAIFCCTLGSPLRL